MAITERRGIKRARDEDAQAVARVVRQRPCDEAHRREPPDARAPWASLPAELVSVLFNGTDALGRALFDARWRFAARSVCRAWRQAVENPTPSDAARIAACLVDPRKHIRDAHAHGRLVCASVLIERLKGDPRLAPDGAVAWAAACVPRGIGCGWVAAALVASGRADAVAHAFSARVTHDAVSSLRAWLRNRRNRSVDIAAPPPCVGAMEGPDAWWVPRYWGGPAVRPWDDVRHGVGGCAAAALSAMLLRAAARHGSTRALDMLMAVGEAPCGVCDAAFDAAAAGHPDFVLRLVTLAGTGGGIRGPSIAACHHAWMGAAAGGRADVMAALSGAEAVTGPQGTAFARGRRAAEGPGRYPGTACYAALMCDRHEYLGVALARGMAVHNDDRDDDGAAQRCRSIDYVLIDALRVGALSVARWLIDNARPTGASPHHVVSPTTAQAAVVDVAVGGHGVRDDPRTTFAWVRDALGVEPDAAHLGALIEWSSRFAWARTDGTAVRGSLSAARYARLLEALVAVIEVWPRAATVAIARRDDDAIHGQGDNDGGRASESYGACVVRLLMQRVSYGRIPGDGYGRRHARRRSLAALARLADVAASADIGVDPWTVAVERMDAEMAVVDRDRHMAPMRAIDALLGAADVVARCVYSRTFEVVERARGRGLPPVVYSRLLRMRGKRAGIDDDDAVRAWRRWCRVEAAAHDKGQAAMMDRIDAWVARVTAHNVFHQ